MKDFIKKQTVLSYLVCAEFVLSLIAFILYLANGANAGYFQGTTTGNVILVSLLALFAEIGALVLIQFHFAGILDKIMSYVEGALIIVAPALLMAGLLMFVSSRAQGLAYIFGADENTLAEIQTPANMASAKTAIFGFIFYGVASLVGIVSAFFHLPEEVAAKSEGVKA
jgi:preprotein translocase subunit SecG